MLLKPRPIQQGTNPEPDNGKIDLGTVPLTSFEFSNKSPFFVYVRFDWNETILDADPHVLIDPWAQQTYTFSEGTTRLCYQAAADLPTAPNPGNIAPLFWFNATDRSIGGSVPAYQSVGITDQPAQNLTGVSADVSKLVDTDNANERNTVVTRVLNDLFDRFRLTNTGRLFRGDGTATPTERDLLVLLADNSRNANSAPSLYPDGISSWRRTDAAGGWPGSSNGLIFTISEPSDQYTLQLFVDRDADTVYFRTGSAGDTWAAFETVVSRQWLVEWHNGGVELAAPGIAPGFGAVNPVRLRKSRDGFVQAGGRLTNNSGGIHPAGKRILTLPAAWVPPDNMWWPCVWRSATGTLSDDLMQPIFLDVVSREMRLLGPMGNGSEFDLGVVSWWNP